jgi:hypothetical protein
LKDFVGLEIGMSLFLQQRKVAPFFIVSYLKRKKNKQRRICLDDSDC